MSNKRSKMKKTVLILAIIVVIIMVSIPVIAATQWNFGGSIRYRTFWHQNNSGKLNLTDLQGGGTILKSDGKLEWGNQPNTKVMIWMKTDSLNGFIDLGYNDEYNSVTTREYWAKYQFTDKFSITIGQQHQLYNSFICGQVGLLDLNLNGIGTSFRAPSPKITFTYGGVGHLFFLPSGFSFALAQPEAKAYNFVLPINSAVFASAGLNPYEKYGITADVNSYFPQLQASYNYYADTWRVKVGGAYEYQKWNKIRNHPFGINTKRSQNVHSWLTMIDGDILFGPLWLGANATIGQNWGNSGMMNGEGGAAWIMENFTQQIIASGHFDKNGKWKDTTSLMGSIVAAYQLAETLRLEAGISYRYDNNKIYKKSSQLWAVYLQASYAIAPGFDIIPEIGYIDRGKIPGVKGVSSSNVNAGNLWYAGALWVMSF